MQQLQAAARGALILATADSDTDPMLGLLGLCHITWTMAIVFVAASMPSAAATAQPTSIPTTMRAVQARAPGCGAPDFGCVGVVTVPVPSAAPDQVLIRVNSSSCGVTDVVESSARPWFPLGPHRLLGYTVAGTVAAVGEAAAAAARLKIGDAVWTMLGGRGERQGAWAEYVAVAAEGVALFDPADSGSRDDGVPALTAVGTLPGPALTNWFGFQACGGLPWGNSSFKLSSPNTLESGGGGKEGPNSINAVIVSGSGGTGYVAVQLAKALGAKRVITAATSDSTMAWVRSLGADVVVDYKRISALEAVPDASVDFVYDNHGAAGTVELAMRKLRRGGAFVSIVNSTLAPDPPPGIHQAYFELPDTLGGNETRKRVALDHITKLIAARKIRPFVQALYSLEAAPAALHAAAVGSAISKFAVIPSH